MHDIPDGLSDALRGRYELLRVLGRGGMATVYLAHDVRHQREVAIKIMRPDLAATLGTDRFLKEVQIAARLTHPHILALHESGEAGGVLYYTMPFIDGPNLRQIIEKERRLEAGAALAVAAPVADALTYAHRMGIFHRDIKPENILFSQGHPIVADFGIARAINTAGGGRNLTRTGFPVGTPGYMSPEQAAGIGDLDEKTDVYSLAIVIYEMIVGEVPGRWPMDDAVKEGRFLQAPSSHRAHLARAGERIEGALIRAMALSEKDRTATPQALMDDLYGGKASGETARLRYNDDEVREIVRRAAEMESQLETLSGLAPAVPLTAHRSPLTENYTVGGAKALAAEVGISPDLVERAAAQVRTPSGSAAITAEINKDNWWLGAPLRLIYERVVDGEVPDVEFPMMVDEIRLVLRNVGTVSQLGRSFSWSALRSQGGTGRAIEITVTVRGGRTRIIVQELLGPLIGAVYGGIGGGMGGGVMGPMIPGLIEGLGMNPLGLIAIIPMWLTATFAVARSTYHYTVKKRKKELELLADRLAELAREVSPRRPRIGAPL